ncbi:INGR1 protein, partial [Eurystomus gularis]|nr:INGR1 protein [Eurystomus gularis]
VPSPTQIEVKSENFNTTLHWEYPPVSETTRFIVEIKSYNSGSYKHVSTCVNISARFCDISGEIDGFSDPHWIRVKAVTGSQQSEYGVTDEVLLRKHGKF